MKVRVSYLKDIIGSNYIGVNIYTDMVTPYLVRLKSILVDSYDEYIGYQKNRDGDKYHITIFNVHEYNSILRKYGIDKVTNILSKYFEYEFNVTFMGLGKATKNENTAYFIVVKSEEIQEVRRIFGLDEKDLHITLGFKYKDVHGVPKNIVLDEKDPFIKMMSLEFDKYQTFDFIKFLKNFDGDIEGYVEPIKIEDTYATFRVGYENYYSVSLVDDELIISAKWVDKEKKPILPNTIVNRKMKY